MQTDFSTLAVGIVSSLLATAFFMIAAEVFRRVILPWYRNLVYSGVRIDGEWLHDGPPGSDGKSRPLYLHLVQKAHIVTGRQVHYDDSGKMHEAEISGVLRDGYFSAIIFSSNPHRTDGCCLMLHVHSENGMVLKGGVLTLVPLLTSKIGDFSGLTRWK